jgi:hypothetical protein
MSGRPHFLREQLLNSKTSSFPRRQEPISGASVLPWPSGENIAPEMDPRLRGDDDSCLN